MSDLRIYTDVGAEVRLGELGLSVEVMRNAMLAGLRAAMECTDDDPSIVRGMLLFGKIVRSLREQLKADGWEKETTRNLELTVQADGQVKLMVASGNRAAGDPEGKPETARERGLAVFEELRGQGFDMEDALDGIAKYLPANTEFVGGRWVMLYHREDNALSAEVSLPYSIEEGTRISRWRERIILPRVGEQDLGEIDQAHGKVPLLTRDAVDT